VVPAKYFDLYPLDSPLAMHQYLPNNMPSVAIGQGLYGGGPGHGELNNFADLDAINFTTKFPFDNTTVPEDAQQRIRQAYRAAISYTDRNVGVVLDALREEHLFKSTIVILWSDHGYHLGDNDLWGV
jgi:iduronate 2-sulfatase